MTSPRDHLIRDVPEVRLGLAAAVAFVALPVVRLLPPHDALVGYAAGLMIAAAVLPILQGQLLAVTVWGLVTGFAVNSGGQLTFAPNDLARLAALIGAAAAAYALRSVALSGRREPAGVEEGEQVGLEIVRRAGHGVAVHDVAGIVVEGAVLLDPGHGEPRAGQGVGLGADPGDRMGRLAGT
jgi:hypothetical protein